MKSTPLYCFGALILAQPKVCFHRLFASHSAKPSQAASRPAPPKGGAFCDFTETSDKAPPERKDFPRSGGIWQRRQALTERGLTERITTEKSRCRKWHRLRVVRVYARALSTALSRSAVHSLEAITMTTVLSLKAMTAFSTLSCACANSA